MSLNSEDPPPPPPPPSDRVEEEEEEEGRPSPPESSSEMEDHVPLRQRLAYGLGHILNDLCASMWFTYLLLFFRKVLQFDNFLAGIIMLVGQIADGLSTLFVGYFSDKENCISLCDKYGKRKSWHAVGTFCVLVSFPFIFIHCLGCSNADFSAQAIYYSAFVIIFQFGWAATQISHLSIIPDLTPLTSERGRLTSLRYGATVGSNVMVYLVAWAFLGATGQADIPIGPSDATNFRNVMLVVICVGLAASLCFHGVTKVPRNEENRLNAGGGGNGRVNRMRPLDWFREPQFYQTAGVYMTTRLFVNLTQGYIPIYLQITLQLPGTSVAVIPLVIFACGFLTSLTTEKLMPKMGIFYTLFVGAAVAIGSCCWIQASDVDDSSFRNYEIYAVAAMVGIGGSILLISSLTLTAGLIGPNTETGAFVYGAMSLTDKFSNGLAFVLIQKFIPSNVDTCIECRLYFRTVLFGVCGGSALLAAVFAATMLPFRLGERRRERRTRLRATANAYEELPGDDGGEDDDDDDGDATVAVVVEGGSYQNTERRGRRTKRREEVEEEEEDERATERTRLLA